MTPGHWLGVGIVASLVLGAASLWITGRTTGWRRLAGSYPAVPPGDGRRVLLGRVWFRWTGYGNLVWVHADERHLHFSLWLRLGHPRFSVPWQDIHAERIPSRRWRSLVRLSFQRVPGVTLRILGIEADKVVAASGDRIRVEDRPEP